MSAASHNPPRLLIPGGFGFAYATVRLAPEYGWGPAALLGALLLALIVWGPRAIKASAKAAAVRAAAKRKKAAEEDKKKEGGK